MADLTNASAYYQIILNAVISHFWNEPKKVCNENCLKHFAYFIYCKLLKHHISNLYSWEFQVSVGDGLPQQICHRCLYQVNKWYKFRNLCKNSDVFLHQYVTKVQENQVRYYLVYISAFPWNGLINLENLLLLLLQWCYSLHWALISSLVPSSIPILASLFHSLTLPNPLFFWPYPRLPPKSSQQQLFFFLESGNVSPMPNQPPFHGLGTS
jgi:Zinc-finger associated domain (zf-AD).